MDETRLSEILSTIPKSEYQKIWFDKQHRTFYWLAEYFGGGYERYQDLSLDPNVPYKERTGITNREWFPDQDSGYQRITFTQMKTMLFEELKECQARQNFAKVMKELSMISSTAPPGVFSSEGGKAYHEALHHFESSKLHE